MPSGCWITVWLLLLLPAVTQAQSGEEETDTEPRLSCTSHIMTEQSSLTCELVGGKNYNEDDEDDEADGIEKMTVCYTDWSEPDQKKCVEDFGDTVSSQNLNPVNHFSVTAHLKRGGKVTAMIDLKKIVKPRSPEVWNVTFNQESNQAVIYIRTPYHREFLKKENQLFQLHIWTAGSTKILNISSLEMKIDMEHLQQNTEYHVKVRAIPQLFLAGTWSDWSETFSFFTPAGDKVKKETDERQETYTLIVCLVLLVVLTFSVVFFWKNKIFTYMWPSIPHPKHTLVQICKPNKGLLLNFKPEVFSALKVYPMEKTEEQPCDETEPSIAASAPAAESTQSNHACSTQSSDCSRSTTSVSTEELELSALLSRSSSDGEDSLQSTSPSPIRDLQFGETPHAPQRGCSSEGNEAELFGVSQQEEAYVTMSSFYQIK
ncbi:interleukin-7 receptor subunit alpha [Dicentrarchus labrax]|uniref:Fibronectin type-III domain-containing protein n=1 Tax=Dicentrarchus labrax TaxID=13489 RepID=A0A8P4GRH7_DICLA|nr:interleukin-7 receptor subunit alpha [Dicentrarchus labrax]